MIRLLLLMRHKLEAFCVAHGRSILDRLAVLLVKEGHLVWVQIQNVSDLVADIRTDSLVTAVFKPNLHDALLLSNAQPGT